MRNLIKFALLSLVIMTVSCVESQNPLYTEHDLIFDSTLIGVWIDNESKETWELTKGDGQQYKLIHTDENNRKKEFTASLLKIGDKKFLDLVPAASDHPSNDSPKDHSRAAHSFILITQTGASFQISYLEPEGLKKLLNENPKAIRHEKIQGEILLTAPSKELQDFLVSNLKSVFSVPVEITRQK